MRDRLPAGGSNLTNGILESEVNVGASAIGGIALAVRRRVRDEKNRVAA